MEINPSHVIATDRCNLRYPSEVDIPHVWSASRVAGFNDGMLWDPPMHPHELEEPLRRNIDSWERGDAFTWSIDSRDRGEFIGRIAIRKELAEGEWSIGFWIHPTIQGHGYATEAARAIVEFGFQQLDAVTISAAHATWNEASRKVLEAIGMVRVRTNPEGFMKRGEWIEECEYEMHAK